MIEMDVECGSSRLLVTMRRVGEEVGIVSWSGSIAMGLS